MGRVRGRVVPGSCQMGGEKANIRVKKFSEQNKRSWNLLSIRPRINHGSL